jgi:GNAT superfamily N-acetyltransferase
MIGHVTIRSALLRDDQAIARIYVDSWRVAYQGILPRNYLSGLSLDRTVRSVRRSLMDPQALYFIAEGDQGPVGYISAGPERGQDPVYTAEVYELYVSPDNQRRGAGRKLLAHMARRLHQAGCYTLLVWVLSRNPNRRFYEKCGGIYLRTKSIIHAGQHLQVVAYGWIDITMAM